MSKLATALENLFDRNRIVFWYDEKKELRQEFDEVWLTGVEKLEIAGNEFWLKHHILREKSSTKFLLYHAGPKPANEKNWLLDVLLAQTEFRADQVSLWLSELGLLPKDWGFVQAHQAFFKTQANRKKFHTLFAAHPSAINEKERILFSACLNASTLVTLEEILTAMLDELAKGQQSLFKKLQEFGLEDYLWDWTQKELGYQSEHLSPKDFAISLFKTCYALELNQEAEMKADALVFMHRWKDSVRYRDSFETLSAESAQILNVENDLQQRTINELLDIDLFMMVDQRLVTEMIHQVSNRTLSGGDVNNFVWQRRKSHWYGDFEDLYLTVQFAAKFLSLLEQSQLEINDIQYGASQYARNWYQLDRFYRKALHHARQARQTTLLGDLFEQIENLYTNRFLLTINDCWQQQVNALDQWKVPGMRMQKDFYRDQVQPFVEQQRRLVVIISDALRYEVASELIEKIQQLNGYEAELEAMLGILPSYTQLGMAALLPHQTLEIKPEGTVFIDGQSSAGLENRARILQQTHENRATAVKAEEVLSMDRKNLRSLLKNYPLVYIYHNQIDMVGDKRDSEQRVFEAVEDTMEELISLIKKVVNANTYYVLVTADHGFLYQDREVDESEFAGEDVRDEGITYKNRRFVLGHQINESSSVKKYQPSQLGVDGDVEILIPKSINRLRKQGAGSRFVHGGSSLQEIILPVITVHKVESKDTPQVSIEILQGTVTTITSNQISVTFFQKEPVQGNLMPRVLRAGFYTQDGTLISDRHELTFDLASENAADRGVKVRFMLNQAAEAFNDQGVSLRLEEQAADTSHYSIYKQTQYTLRKSFTSDFDF